MNDLSEREKVVVLCAVLTHVFAVRAIERRCKVSVVIREFGMTAEGVVKDYLLGLAEDLESKDE